MEGINPFFFVQKQWPVGAVLCVQHPQSMVDVSTLWLMMMDGYRERKSK
jgi:hypothetical protein